MDGPAAVGDLLGSRRINQPEKRTGRLVMVSGDRGSVEALVREAVTSPEALERLCDLYVPKIYGYVLKRVGKVEDAEDVTSVVFEKVLLNIETFDEGKASFSTWIYRIALNCITDFYRSRGRKKEDAIDDVAFHAKASTGDGLERLDLQMFVIELVRQLPIKYQEAVTLRYFGDMRVLEVAETLGISETAASKRILRGLDQMKRMAAGGPLEDML